MEIKIIENSKQFLELKNAWKALEIKSDEVTFYSTYDYLYNWYVFNKSNNFELKIICVFEKNEIIGIAPLMIENRKIILFRTKVLRFIGRADFHNFIIDSDVKQQSVLKKIFETIKINLKWDKLELSHVANNTYLSFFCLKSELYNLKFEHLGENPIIDLNKNDDFAVYKKIYFKKKINYYKNKLKKELNTSLEVVLGNTNNILDEISSIHISRNANEKGRRSLFENKAIFNLIKKIYTLDKQGITFVLRTAKGDIVSYATCYQFNKTLHNWNTSYNLSYSDYSAGDLIYLEMVNYAFENRDSIEVIDFGAGRYPWKFRMTSTFIPTYKLNYNNKESNKFYILEAYDKLFKIGKILFK